MAAPVPVITDCSLYILPLKYNSLNAFSHEIYSKQLICGAQFFSTPTQNVTLTADMFNAFICLQLFHFDRLCGLVVRVLGYRSGGPGSIPGTTRFSEKKKENK
jgi:hypothetical protein